MESKFDIVTIASAVGVAAYVAIATGFVAHYHLGFSFDSFGKKLGKAK